MKKRIRSLCILLAAASLLGSCAIGHLEFSRVSEFEPLSPRDSGTVHLPFVLRWTAPSGSNRFLVLFDRVPIRPGQTLLALVPKSDPCRLTPGCPDPTWLANLYMYVTSEPELKVDNLPNYQVSKKVRDHHTVTIIRLSGDKRLDESAITSAFFVDHGV